MKSSKFLNSLVSLFTSERHDHCSGSPEFCVFCMLEELLHDYKEYCEEEEVYRERKGLPQGGVYDTEEASKDGCDDNNKIYTEKQ